jgi:UDP-2-acetamido-2,6-beta-L-arabino-hexul-4-ose reductase
MANVLITGADGFVAKNLAVHIAERRDLQVLRFTRDSAPGSLRELVRAADYIVHLAGVNRPADEGDFTESNVGLTGQLCELVAGCDRPIPIIYSSSIQAERDNAYGRSKLQAEQVLRQLHDATRNPIHIFRLPNVFGKWCRPHYNSAVATFCHNIARQLPVEIHDPHAALTLVYVDDVVSTFLALIDGNYRPQGTFAVVTPEYGLTVGELAEQIRAFRDCRTTLISERVGSGLTRALYATYVSHLPPQDFVYDIPRHSDQRGVFVEMLKTIDSGQFSYFTAHPGVTRGGHYHHSKTEKFLVIRGSARFRFRHLISEERQEIVVTGERPQIVETVPGWTHDITNIGESELVVMLWANEVFDRSRPDTIAKPL